MKIKDLTNDEFAIIGLAIRAYSREHTKRNDPDEAKLADDLLFKLREARK